MNHPVPHEHLRREPVLAHPLKLGDIRRAYTGLPLAFGATLPFVLTLLAWALHGAVSADGGTTMVGTTPTPPLVWALASLNALALASTRRALDTANRTLFWLVKDIESIVQIAWLNAFAFYCAGFFPLLGMAVLTGVIVAGAYNDAFLFYDSGRLKASYIIAFIGCDVLLLLVDAAGGVGIRHAAAANPSLVLSFLTVQGLLIGTSQAIISFAGRAARAHDEQAEEQARLQRDVDLFRQERAVVQRLCGVLQHGLAAGRFSHDVASPLTVISGYIELLESGLQRGTGRADASPALDGLAPIVRGLKEANERLMEMTQILARSVKGIEPPVEQSVAALMDQALDHMRHTLKGHSVEAPEPVVDLEQATVQVSSGHAAALGNIMTNGVLQAPATALRIVGRRLDADHYLVCIRDFGVAVEASAEALTRVRSAIDLKHVAEREPAEAPQRYRGFGIGLMMAKVLLVRYDGWLEVAVPAEGPGLVLCAALASGPRTAAAPPEEDLVQRIRAAARLI